MSAPAKCPLCGTKLQPDWESCPNCPMSFLDAPPEKTAFQNDNFRSFGIPILFFGGLAFFLWTGSQYLWRTAEESTKTLSANIKVPPVTIPGEKSVVAAKPLKLDPTDATPTPEESAGPGTISIMPNDRPKAKVVAEWKMRGVIYDLITLQPVPSVHMIFLDNRTNSRAQIQTDLQGRYRAILPALAGRGYLVSLSKPGYSKTYLDPGTEGVSEMTRERRIELGHELSSTVAEPSSLQPNSDLPLVTDFHLAPQ